MNKKLEKKRILVVDDDVDVCKVIKRYLSKKNFSVDVAYDEEEALKKLVTKDPDLVLTDLIIPKLDGYRFIEEGMKIKPDIPYLVISGVNDIDKAIDMIRLGACDFLTKPLEMRTLLHRMEQSFEKQTLLLKYKQQKNTLEDLVVQQRDDFKKAYKELVDNFPLPMFEGDKTGKITYANLAAVKLTGYELEEVKHKKYIYDLVHPRYVKKAVCNAQKVFQGYDSGGNEYLMLNKEGEKIPVMISSTPNYLDGKVVGIRGYVSDLRDIKNNEKKLRKKEKEFRGTLENLLVGVIVRDTNLNLLYSNKKAQEIFGLTATEMRKKTLSEKYIEYYSEHGEKIEFDKLPSNVVIKTNRPLENYILGIKNVEQNTLKWVHVNSMPKNENHKNPAKVITNFVDVTVQKNKELENERLKDRLFQSQKLEAIGTLAGGIAHDFNNILAGILGYVQLTMMDVSEENKIHSYQKKIYAGCERAKDLVNQILTFSRKVKMEKKPINLNDSVRSAYHFLRQTIPSMIEINLDLDKNLDNTYANETQMYQVVMNLVTNSYQALPNDGVGGKINISTSNVYLDQTVKNNIINLISGDYVKLLVEDNGRGIPQKQLENIFDPFFTTKRLDKGTGLGLANVHGIVTEHRGYIDVFSETPTNENDEYKRGRTMFEIYLPKSRGKLDLEEKLEVYNTKGDETLLVVDDEEEIRNISKEFFNSLGYKVMTAKDGEGAIDLYENNKIDLVILDLGMPGMGGRKAFEVIYQKNPKVKAIISSGNPGEYFEGPRVFVNKPYEFGEIKRVVRSILDEK